MSEIDGMKADPREAFKTSASAASDEAEDLDAAPGSGLPLWFPELAPGGNGEGFIEKAGKHSMMFVRRPNPRLLVTFDNLANVNDASPERVPWAFKFARELNISHLGIMAHVADWYRDADLIERMRKLADEGFFEGYERVVFAGTSMGAFAAISFASLAPGAHVMAFNPQSTLDEALVPWETRYWSGRRQDWTLPLSNAAALTSELGPVSIFYDPFFDLDQSHIDRLSGDNLRIFKCWFSAHKTAVFLRKIDALKTVMHQCIFEELTEAAFYRLYRRRRNLPWYRGSVSGYFRETDRTEMAERATRAFRQNMRRSAAAPEAQQGDALCGTAAPVVLTQPLRNDKIVLLTTMKNEGPFMLEWIAYNRAIGFSDFLIYTNGCEDGTDAIATRLQELGLAVHEDNRFKKGASPQRVALRRGFNHEHTKDADWLICADCDEFLNIDAGDGRLPDLFEAVGHADAISVCWKIFGCGGRLTYADKPVTETFTWSAGNDFAGKYRARGLKTLVRRNEKLLRLSVHRPKFVPEMAETLVWKDGGGQPMPRGYLDQGWSAHREFASDHARLHHYAVRSIDSFLVKRDRGRTNHIDRDQGLVYWADMNLNMVKDESILPRVPAMKKELDQLMSDPELARLHKAAVAWHRAKIAELKKRDGWGEFRAAIKDINPPGADPVDKSVLLNDPGAEADEVEGARAQS